MIISISSLCFYLLFTKSVLTIGKMKQCRRKDRLITGKRDEFYELVDATNSQQIIIECHFCEEKDDHNPKIWYKQLRPFLKPPEELQWNNTLDPNLLRVYVNPEHALVIKNYTPNLDEGLYYCHGINDEEIENQYNYLVDTVMNVNETEVEVGDANIWRNYYDAYIEPINKDLVENYEDNIANNSTATTHQLEAMTEWESWGNCVVCGLPEGQRRRRGKCRLKATQHEMSLSASKAQRRSARLLRRQTNSDVLVADIKTSPDGTEDSTNSTAIEDQSSGEIKLSMDDMFRVTPIYSCKSVKILRLAGIPSEVTTKLRHVPDFIQVEKCHGVCRKKAAGAPSKLQFGLAGQAQGARLAKADADDDEEMSEDVIKEAEKEEEEDADDSSVKGGGFRLMELQHGEPLRLVCPGASASSVVTWTKNGQILGVSGGQDSNPVDALGTLLIGAVAAGDAGNYACAVDGAESTVVGVSVELPPMLKTAEFLRHNVYLGVVIGICLIVYCSGLVIAYTQKHRFRSSGYAKVNTTEEGGTETGF